MQILFSGAIPGPAEERGVTAILGVLDTESGEIVHRYEHRGGLGGGASPKVQFTGFSFLDGELFACTHTEIVGFAAWPPQAPTRRISIPGFNDLHHCLPWRGGLAVANTGLETVDEVSIDGELVRRHDLLAGSPDAREIDPDRDYRLIADTKPHAVHANHLFVLDGELWVTQLGTKGAVAVEDLGARIEIPTGMPHDGRPVGDRLVFTTVNGFVVFVDRDRRTQSVHELTAITPGKSALGWCRGVCVDEQRTGHVYVGFTAVRRTAWRSYAFQVKYHHAPPRSRVALYDLERGELLREFDLGDDRFVLFQLEALPEDRWL